MILSDENYESYINYIKMTSQLKTVLAKSKYTN